MRILGFLAATAVLLVTTSSASAQVVVNPMEVTPSPMPQFHPEKLDPIIPSADDADRKSNDVDVQGNIKHYPTVSVPEPGALILTGAAVIWAVGSWRRRRREPVQDAPLP